MKLRELEETALGFALLCACILVSLAALTIIFD
jgi:hypothetical protein